MNDLVASLRIAAAVLLALLVVGAIAWRRPLVPPPSDVPQQRFGYPGWVRWTFLAMAATLTTLLLAAGSRLPVTNAALGLCLALGFGAVFAAYSRSFVEVTRDAVVFVGPLGRRAFALADIREIVEISQPRGGHGMVARGEGGRRLFVLSENLQGFWEAVGRVKQGVANGTVIRQAGMGSGERIVSRHGNDRPAP